jgi:uncharacterized membrane protein
MYWFALTDNTDVYRLFLPLKKTSVLICAISEKKCTGLALTDNTDLHRLFLPLKKTSVLICGICEKI